MENSEAPVVSTPRSVGIRFGLISAAISIAYFLVLTFAGVDMSSGIGRWAGIPIAIVLVVLAHKNFKDTGDGFMSYGQGFSVALWMAIVSSVVATIFTYFYIKFIDPTFVQMIRDKAIADMEAQGQSDEQIETAMKFVDMFTSAEMILVFGIIGGIIQGTIIGLLVSIFTKKENPTPSF